MRHLYLYGCSDDCHEIEGDWEFESYGDIELAPGLIAHYEYHGDWGIRLAGEIPPGWIVKTICGNAPEAFREHLAKDGLPAGQFIHIQIPDDAERPSLLSLGDDEEWPCRMTLTSCRPALAAALPPPANSTGN